MSLSTLSLSDTFFFFSSSSQTVLLPLSLFSFATTTAEFLAEFVEAGGGRDRGGDPLPPAPCSAASPFAASRGDPSALVRVRRRDADSDASGGVSPDTRRAAAFLFSFFCLCLTAP